MVGCTCAIKTTFTATTCRRISAIEVLVIRPESENLGWVPVFAGELGNGRKPVEWTTNFWLVSSGDVRCATPFEYDLRPWKRLRRICLLTGGDTDRIRLARYCMPCPLASAAWDMRLRKRDVSTKLTSAVRPKNGAIVLATTSAAPLSTRRNTSKRLRTSGRPSA